MWSQPQLSRQSHLEGGVGFGDVIEFGMLPENSAELSFGREPCEKRGSRMIGIVAWMIATNLLYQLRYTFIYLIKYHDIP